MIDRGRLGAEYSGVRRMSNGGSASSGTSLKDAYGQAASSMRAAGVTSVSGANTTQAAREAVSRAAATARSAPEVRTMAYDLGNMVEIGGDDDDYSPPPAAATPAPAPPPAAAPVSAATKGPVLVPPPRPTAQPGFLETLKSVPGAIARDVKMGYQAGLFRNRDTQRENLLEAGYTPAQIDDYFARTDATIARNEAEAAARSDRDDMGIMSLPGSPSATPVASAEELARLFSEGQDITGKTQADLQPLVEQFLRGRGITDFGTYMPKIFETLQVPLAPAVSQTPLPPAPVFVTPSNVMGSQPAAVAPNFVSPAPVTPAPVIPPFVPITPVGQAGAYSPPPFAPITRAEGGPVDKIPGVLYMQDGGDPLAKYSGKAPGYEDSAVYYRDASGNLQYGIGALPGQPGYVEGVSPRGTLIEDQAAAQREWQAANAKSQAAKDMVVDYFTANPAAYYENMDLALSAPSSDLMWNRQAGPGGSMIAPETLARALEWSSSGREQYDLGFDAAGNAIAIPKGTVTLPNAASSGTSQPALPQYVGTQTGSASSSSTPLPTITPVGQTAAYSPPPLPAAPSYGVTPSGQPAYSPYGQTLPFSFPQLSIPQLTPSFFQYLPPLPPLPQNQPLV